MLNLNKKQLKSELERELIGICLFEPLRSSEILPKMTYDDLELENQNIYSVFMNLGNKDLEEKPVLFQILKSNGIDYINYVKTVTFAVTDLIIEAKQRSYFEIVTDIKAENLIRASLLKLTTGENPLDTVMEIKETLDTFIEGVNVFRNEQSIGQRFDKIVEKLENEKNNPSADLSLKSELFPTFNSMTHGLKPGNVCVISGAFKQGKTTFALQLLMDICNRMRVNGGIFSLEMTEEELDRKFLAIKANIQGHKIREARLLSDGDISSIKCTRNYFNKVHIYTSDKTFTESQIKAKTKSWIKNFHVGLILIDYIGLVEPQLKSKGADSREREVAHLSRYFKNMAKELNIPILLLAQLNRSGLNDPSSINIAESIAIARDADFLFTIYKPLDIGIKDAEFESGRFTFTDSSFVVTLNNSRHTKSGSSMVLSMTDTGEFIELSTEYNINN